MTFVNGFCSFACRRLLDWTGILIGTFLIGSSPASAECGVFDSSELFCDDFESGDAGSWIDVTKIVVDDAPNGIGSSGFAAKLDYEQGSNGAGWMWKKQLRDDSSNTDKQYMAWWQYWGSGFQWSQGPGDQKLFSLQALSPQTAWAQTANWKIYLHLVGNERQDAGVAVNELYLDTFIWSGGSQWDGQWKGLQQNRSKVLYRTGIWECTEIEVTHNTPGIDNGSVRVWINDELVMDHQNLKLRDDPISWNAILLSAYYGDPGVPQDQVSYIDNVVVSSARIGCDDEVRPKPPGNLTAD